jgi:hypothetical protein
MIKRNSIRKNICISMDQTTVDRIHLYMDEKYGDAKPPVSFCIEWLCLDGIKRNAQINAEQKGVGNE